jgi:predicted nucleotidyltransferase
MLDLIEARRAEVAVLCQGQHVRRLELFGSASRGDFDAASSDLDFLVEFIPGATAGRALDAYFGLKESLEELFGRPVDLVMSDAVTNPYVRANINRSRETVYAAA